MELEVEALQRLEESEPDIALWPCTDTCAIASCGYRTEVSDVD